MHRTSWRGEMFCLFEMFRCCGVRRLSLPLCLLFSLSLSFLSSYFFKIILGVLCGTFVSFCYLASLFHLYIFSSFYLLNLSQGFSPLQTCFFFAVSFFSLIFAHVLPALSPLSPHGNGQIPMAVQLAWNMGEQDKGPILFLATSTGAGLSRRSFLAIFPLLSLSLPVALENVRGLF